ncbi:protein DpdG [Paraburkholderia tropica]|uniref:protein DpdG n=1 Tax=Paraburkholderia tropica TaxID=92647 RepID=UPI002ABE10C0|nr:protein DpdG [Paraburkholderia tropica]
MLFAVRSIQAAENVNVPKLCSWLREERKESEMAILNMESDGMPGQVLIALKALVTFGPMTKDRLIDICAPEPAIEPKRFRAAVTRWTQLGLFTEVDGRIRIASDYNWLSNLEGEEAIRQMPTVVREVALSEINNRKFWDADSNLSADFTRAAAWMLAQDIYTLPSSPKQIQTLESRQIGNDGRRVLQNETRWNGFKHWSVFMGFASGDDPLVIDPTAAVRDSLPNIFKEADTLAAVDFIETLARLLPVLDFGSYRQLVEAEIRNTELELPSGDALSMSLSRALKRLEIGGLINFEARADAKQGYSFRGFAGRPWGRFTHIIYHGEA